MLATSLLLAASLMRLGDLAEAVDKDSCDRGSDFCVTGTVAYVLIYQEKFCHILVDDEGIERICNVNMALIAGE